jgi:hypothetical protein
LSAVPSKNEHAGSPTKDSANDSAEPHVDAQRFLNRLGPGPYTFQTLPESPVCRGRAQVRHGNLADGRATLEADNKKGKAIAVMVNAGDGNGRKADNVVGVRALFVDLDGAPLNPVMSSALPPHMVVETSPGRFHAYWCVDGIARDEFTAFQLQLAERFGGDPAVKDLSRPMRLPGFLHQKGTPYRTRLLHCDDDAPRYMRAQMVEAFALKPPQAAQARPTASASVVPFVPIGKEGQIAKGDRNRTLFALACGWRDNGLARQEAEARLLKTNTTRCVPPLPDAEVRDIVKSTYSVPARAGFARLPYWVIDSAKFKALPTNAVKLLLIAMRQFNGRNNGNISLPHEGLKSYGKGLADPKAVRSAIRALRAAGLLRITRPPVWRDGGKTKRCALYEITFLKNHAQPDDADW